MNPFLEAYRDLIEDGRYSSPRGQRILEIEDYQMVLNPIADRFTNFAARKMNIDYAKKEMAWYYRGNRYEMSITDEAQMWKTIVDIDSGINSNYGQYIFHDQEQYKWVIDELSNDMESRRAVMTLLNQSHLRANNPDVVCTYSIGFRIRNYRLNMSIHMRSWDAIWGMTNDVFCFSVIYETILELLRERYPGLKVGRYTHTADSFHVYERHFEMLENLDEDGMDGFTPILCPPISGYDEANWLISHSLVDEIPKHYFFANWLIGDFNGV